MADRYELDQMLKEIANDAPPETARTNRKLSQDEITKMLAARRPASAQPEAESKDEK